jgi:tetratricopeptide (TPR) repeat protein
MKRSAFRIKAHVATLGAALCLVPPVYADDGRVGELLEALQDAEGTEARRIAGQIRTEWSKSGSAAMDLLLRRGREAMEDEDLGEAVEHLTALTDHAPDFAEGWAARALVFYQQGEYMLALSDLERALALNPRHFGALQGVGAIMQRLDRPELAWRAYEAVLALYPENTQVREAMESLDTTVRGRDL